MGDASRPLFFLGAPLILFDCSQIYMAEVLYCWATTGIQGLRHS